MNTSRQYVTILSVWRKSITLGDTIRCFGFACHHAHADVILDAIIPVVCDQCQSLLEISVDDCFDHAVEFKSPIRRITVSLKISRLGSILSVFLLNEILSYIFLQFFFFFFQNKVIIKYTQLYAK